MSDLQFALLAIGAVVIIAVVAYNKWQESRYRKSAERSFAPNHEDALLDPVLPSRRDPATAGQRASNFEALRREPTLADPVPEARQSESDAIQEDAIQVPTDAGAESAIDFVVWLTSDRVIESSRLIETAVLEFAKFSKPVRLEGLDTGSGTWRAVGHGGAYSNLRASIQLVDRQGPISTDELTRFEAAAGRMAATLDVKAVSSTQMEALDRAAALDRFCGDVDVQIAFNVVAAAAPFRGSQLAALAEAAGLVLEDDGKFYSRDAAGDVLFAMSGAQGRPFRREAMNGLVVSAVVLELDVPRTPSDIGAFDALHALAERIAETLGGKIADDNHVTIGAPARQAIRAQLEKIYSAMADYGIPAGSGVAFRLFS